MGTNLVKFKKILMTSSVIRKYDIIIVILMSQQPKKWKVCIVFFVFRWIKLKYGSRTNFRLQISNLNPSCMKVFGT